MFNGRGGDRRMKWSTHKSLWWVSHSEEAFLNFALMGLVSLPIIIWAIIFLLVISRNELALLHSGKPLITPIVPIRSSSKTIVGTVQAKSDGSHPTWLRLTMVLI